MNRQIRVPTVDVLPMDFQLWTAKDRRENPQDLLDDLSFFVSNAVDAELSKRGYQVISNIGWDGIYTDGDGDRIEATKPGAVVATVQSLSGYGRAVEKAGRLLVPHLPAPLGEATHSDATLYVSGWSYVGNDGPTSEEILIGVLIAVVFIVVIAAVLADGKSGGTSAGKHGGAHTRSSSGGGSGLVGLAHGTRRVATSVGGRALDGMIGLARTADKVGEVVLQGMVDSHNVFDACGHSHTHFEFYDERPDYHRESSAPKRGRSELFIDMTLIQNSTGRALWHASETFPANGTKEAHVKAAVQRMLFLLPSAR